MDSLVILTGGVVMMLAVIATAAGIARYSQFYRRELVQTGNREPVLDGLRGMAALVVAAHHAALSRSWLMTGEWGDAQSPILQLCGPGGVIIFFMLTGYLFWGKARGANGRMNPFKLWRSRLFRIAPLYLFSLLFALLVAAFHAGSHWLTMENWRPLLRLFMLGALSWRTVGTVDVGAYNAWVVWTLHYEWMFYLGLPLIAWLAVGRRTFGVALMAYALTMVGLWFDYNFQPYLIFIFGMLCPVLLENQSLRSQFVRPIAALFAVLAVLMLCWLGRDYLLMTRASFSLAAALFPLFFVAAAGNSFFGFLTHPTIRCLGAISFSLYLLHGIMFRLVFGVLKSAGLTHWPQLDYWLIIIATAVATTLLCAATYRWIEFPFLSVSHKKNPKASLNSQPPG